MLDIDAIEKRLRQAVPGPWRGRKCLRGGHVIAGEDTVIGLVHVPYDSGRSVEQDIEIEQATLDLFANARGDLEALIAEVLRLREENKVGLDAFGILEHRRRPADGSPR